MPELPQPPRLTRFLLRHQAVGGPLAQRPQGSPLVRRGMNRESEGQGMLCRQFRGQSITRSRRGLPLGREMPKRLYRLTNRSCMIAALFVLNNLKMVNLSQPLGVGLILLR